MATSEYAMQCLINICESYSREWAFKFSPAKSNVLLYSKRRKNNTCNLTLYEDPIPIVTSAKHVGVLLNRDFNSLEQTLNACRVLRTTALAVLNSGIHPSILNPLTCAKIIKSVCYSKALYGCELWNNLNQTELLSLERAHRFICKTLQGLPFRTRSDKCSSLLGWYSIETYINISKLLFFGRLCRLKSSALPRQILVTRLMEYIYKCVKEQLGFIPDILQIAIKYRLDNFILTFLQTGTFPSKIYWTKIVKENVYSIEENLWRERLVNDDDFQLFRIIHPNIKPHKAWAVAKSFPEFRSDAKYVVDLCSIVRYDNRQLLCDKCGILYQNIIEHLLVSCDRTRDKRDEFWQDIINIDPIDFSVHMDNLSSTDFICTVLSCDTTYELDQDELLFFAKSCVHHVVSICRQFDQSRY